MWARVRSSLWVVAVVALVLLFMFLIDRGVRARHDPPSGEPATVTRSFYAERDGGGNLTGRICTQFLAQTSTDVAIAVPCSYPPAESRIADLLEGAGQ
jgi:hypothetical protein